METVNQIIIIEPEDKVFHLEEHGEFRPEHRAYVASLNLDFVETPYEGEPKYLGITPDLKASYYIGADWLTQDKAVVVTPKIADIDHVGMFMSAIKLTASANYFSKFYGINLSGDKIESPAMDNILTPLLIIHFLFAVDKLLEKGLKKGYVEIEENMKSKIKGRVLMSKQFTKNIVNHRTDRIMCSFHEYSVDIPENRLIKKALVFVNKLIPRYSSLQSHQEFSTINKILRTSIEAFREVSDTINANSVKNIPLNKLYGDYGSAIKMAKQLLRRYDYSIDNIEGQNKMVPPFWIDMSRLYEVYVYSLLIKSYPNQIKFQVSGHYNTAVDFIKMDEELIMDTKYKPQYDESNARIIDDIREISGYARDEKILKELGVYDKDIVPDCIIIYPKMEDCVPDSALLEGKPLIAHSKRINGFKKFYKICVPVPKLKRQSLPHY